ncbi:MAG: GerMN domain-containing protein [Ignavibacteriales bacterium]
MKKHVTAWMVVLAILLMVPATGCGMFGNKQTSSKPTQVKTKLYYASQGNEKLLSEQRTVNVAAGEDKYRAILVELLKGPKTSGLVNNIPPGTDVLVTNKEGTDLTVELSGFKGFPGSMAEIMAVGSIVNTMIAAGDVERVKIMETGKELIGPSGNPRGFMTKFTNPPPAKEFVLYFGNKQADKVVPERRLVTLPENASKKQEVKAVVEELIKGPSDPDYAKTIPPEARVLGVRIDNKTAWVDFSQEMHTRHWGGAAGEAMTINSIVNTLTEIPGIQKVGITVVGEPLNIEHVVMDKPVGRNPDMIGK